MEGTPNLLQREVKCPACSQWTRPHLPQVADASGPQPQTPNNEPARAVVEVESWHNYVAGDTCTDTPQDAPSPPVRLRPRRQTARPTANSATEGWWIRTAKGDFGPFDHKRVVALAKSGKINEKTLMRYGQGGEFLTAGQVRGLIPTAT